MGVTFDPWQEGVARLALGKRKNGKYAATIGGVTLSIPRQVGKTFMLGALVVAFCLEYPNTTVLWTAHRTRTATRTFQAMQGLVRKKRIKPHLAPGRSEGIRTTNGEQEISFRNGSEVLFGAREQGFGRGFDDVTIEIFDEAQILTEKALDDMVPAANQSTHEHGALLFFIGTPPRPVDPGEAFSIRRKKALEGTSEDLVYVEFAADPDADSDDREQWAKANPSYPIRTPLESMLRMREQLTSEESWRREALGIWDAEGSTSVIDATTWARFADPASMAIEGLSLGVEVAPDRSVSTVALGGQRADELWHVEVDEQRAGTAWIADHVLGRCERNKIRAVVVDGMSQAATLIDELQQRGIKVTVTNTREAASASGAFVEQVEAGRVRHIDQPLLNAALGAAGKRLLYNGEAWVWTGKHAALDVTPIRAATLALWGAQHSKVKKPTRSKRGGRRVVTG